MSESEQDTEEVLTEIAQAVKEDGSYELTDEDETRRALGLPAEDDYRHPYGDYDAELIASGSRDTLPITYRLYRLPTGHYIHVKETTKNQGEYYTRYYVKGIGELVVEGRGVNRSDLESECEDLAIPINDEVYNVLDEFAAKTGEILAHESNYVAGVIFTGSKLVVEVPDAHEGWGSLREEVFEHVDEDDFPHPDEVRNPRIETVEDVKDEEWSLLETRAIRCIRTGDLRSYDTDMCAEYAASVELDPSPLLED